jgi:hypothetical protein
MEDFARERGGKLPHGRGHPGWRAFTRTLRVFPPEYRRPSALSNLSITGCVLKRVSNQ